MPHDTPGFVPTGFEPPEFFTHTGQFADGGGGDGDVKLPLSIQPIGGGQGILVDADGIPVVGEDGMPILRSMPTPSAGRAPPAFSGTPEGLAQQAQQDLDFLREQERLATLRGDRQAAQDLKNQIALLERQQAFSEEQARLDREATAEQNRLAEEAAQKRNRLGVLSDLVQGFISAQQGARETLAGLAPDPFALAAGINMMPLFGTTPQQAFQGTLESFVNQPIPQVGGNATLPQIEGAISTATGLQSPPLPASQFGISGLAGGGTVPFGNPQSFLVGEAGPEVMTVSPSGVQVTPLKGAFQAGGSVSAPQLIRVAGRSEIFWVEQTPSGPVRHLVSASAMSSFDLSTVQTVPDLSAFGPLAGEALTSANVASVTAPTPAPAPAPAPTPTSFDVSSLTQALAPIFANLGFSEVPRFGRKPAGDPGAGSIGLPGPGILAGANTNTDILNALGIAPTLVRDPRGAIFFVDRQAGTLRHVSGSDLLNQLGGVRSAINLSDAGIRELGFGLGPQLTALPSAIGQPSPAFGPVSPNILLEPESSTILPAPFRIASQLNRMNILGDPNLANILSGFKSAGFTPESVLGRAGAAVPTGLGQSFIGLR